MDLWIHWYGAIRQLRPGFSRELTFLWFALSVAGLSVRSDKLGISSIVRALSLEPERCYQRLLKHCHSKGMRVITVSDGLFFTLSDGYAVARQRAGIRAAA